MTISPMQTPDAFIALQTLFEAAEPNLASSSVREQLLDECLKERDGKSLLLRALHEILNRPEYQTAIASRSHDHANGFSKIVLTKSLFGTLRLHLWQKPPQRTEQIHTHSSDFTTHILSGEYTEERFALVKNTSQLQADLLWQHTLKVPPPGESADTHTWLPPAQASLSCISQTTRRLGDRYTIERTIPHRVNKAHSGTVSLVLFGPFQTDQTSVFDIVPTAKNQDHYPPKWFNASELTERIQAAISCMTR